MAKGKYLTRSFNNWLTVLIGIPTLAYAIVTLTTSVLSDFTAFIGMAVMGAFY